MIVLDGSNIQIDCVIEDLTFNGAGLRLPSIFSLPETFCLVIMGSQSAFVAEVVWQQGIRVGVRFTDALPRAR